MVEGKTKLYLGLKKYTNCKHTHHPIHPQTSHDPPFTYYQYGPSASNRLSYWQHVRLHQLLIHTYHDSCLYIAICPDLSIITVPFGNQYKVRSLLSSSCLITIGLYPTTQKKMNNPVSILKQKRLNPISI